MVLSSLVDPTKIDALDLKLTPVSGASGFFVLSESDLLLFRLKLNW
jgi:hypothetical protein